MGRAKHRESIDDIHLYYRNNDEESRLSRQQLEFFVTKRLLRQYLPNPCRVLEVGAGSGRYTLELARENHEVIAVELVPELTEKNRKRLADLGHAEKVTLVTADARDLTDHVQGEFDAVLIMGPLYHLTALEDRVQTMTMAKSLVREGGLILTAHLTRLGLIGYMMTRYPEWLLRQPRQAEQVVATGEIPDHPRTGDFRGYFTAIEEARQLHESQGLEIVNLHSQDPCIGSVDEIFNMMPNEMKTKWADFLARVSHDSAALGSGRSLLCVSRKPEPSRR